MLNENKIDRGDLEIEAARWGGQDFYTGSRETDCPYDEPALRKIWQEGFRYCRDRASRFERAVAWVARLMRWKVCK